MKCDIILSLVFYFCGCFYMVYGAVIIAIDAKSKVSRLFLLIASSLAIWSFSCSISNSAPTAQVSAYWRSFSAFGWGVFSSLLLHFLLVLTKTESRLNKRAMFVILYLPALINIILFGPYGLLAEKQYQMAQTDFGWVNMAPMYAERIWLNLYYIIFSIASIIVLFQWWNKTESYPPREKRQIKRFIVSILFVFLIETVIDVLPDILGKKYHPQLPVVSLLIPTIMIFPLLKKTVRIERKNIIHPFLGTEKDLEGDRVRLFNTVTVIFMLGSALSFLIGYFGMNRNLGNELLLAAFLLLMGMVVKCIPLITKNQTAQNSIFLIISISCLLYFIIKHAGTGGLTVWAIYILVLLFTVVLGSSHAYVITAISVVVQIVFWIILPEVSVTIDINEYVARIFIIVLSFVAVQYLINEFTAKIRGYQRFAREQEVLEKISSSFISVNSKNVREKINEMFEMAVEILEFNHAYITGFGQDYKDATIVNMYMKDVDRESFPYYPGMRFSTAELPMFKFLIEQNEPIVCEDTANISFDKDGLHRDYFMSRGVKSFLAIPITIDNKTGGIFFIEYRDRIDGRLAESRLNFLKIIANILGDARNKALYEERLYHSAYFDEATKLANRNMLKIRLEQIIRNRIELEKIAVLNIEIENLRMINDTFAHEVGEQVMIESAAILEKQLEGCYDISRAGEGDFVVVLSEVKCHEQIMECAEKLLASFFSSHINRDRSRSIICCCSYRHICVS